jgi:hypothetical protein
LKREGIVGAELTKIARHWLLRGDVGIDLTADDLALLNLLGVGEMIREAAEFETNPRDFPVLPTVPGCSGCGRPEEAVYFIQQGAGGPVKIGLAKDVRKRLWTLQTSTPAPLFVRATIGGDRQTERALHAFYAREHIRGEWFRPSPRLVAYIREVDRGL